MARLKVFTWSDGFHAFTVAASSRPKALEAWGVEQDLFKSGLAQEVHDGPDHAAALKAPGEVIERGLAVDVGKAAPARRPRGPSKAARQKVAQFETALAELDQRHDDEAATLAERVAVLAREQDALARIHKRERDRLLARLKAAREKI